MALAHQPHVVALHIQHALHLLRIRERRRVEHDHVEALAHGHRRVQPRQRMGARQPMTDGVDPVEGKVARGPCLVGVGQIHRGRSVRARPRGDALGHHGAHGPMVEEQPGIQIGVEVDLEAETGLLHDENFGPLAIELLVL